MKEDTEASAGPLPESERIAALDVLRGFALLGIFIMNMPGFTHSLFAPPPPEANAIDAAAATLRDLLFAGKFNLLFGLVFGIGFALQMERLERRDARSASGIYARRLAFLLGVGLVHAVWLWPGDVLVVYAVLGFVLLALRRSSERVLLALLAACLVFPALAEVARLTIFPLETETVAAFQYQQLEVSNDLAFGFGTFLDAVRETAHVFVWSYSSPLGLFGYAAYYVQMATGILAGYVLGRRGWPGRTRTTLHAPAAWWLAVTAMAIASLGAESIAPATGLGPAVFVAALAKTLGRAALSAVYALAVVGYVREHGVPRWLRPLALAGRMPLSNYLLQTLLASFIFYGWGLGYWGRIGPGAETLLATALFIGVQLPLSAWWLGRFGHGPLELAWRRVTYGRARS